MLEMELCSSAETGRVGAVESCAVGNGEGFCMQVGTSLMFVACESRSGRNAVLWRD
jgi:hypothetical protein